MPEVSPESRGGGCPDISVIIPCYNTHEFLGETLDSLDRQTFRDFEILVIDDGSTRSETIAALDGLGDRVRLIRQENGGLPAARNTGFRAARGRLVLPLDSDDRLEPTFLAQTHAALQAHPEATFAFSWLRLEDEGAGILRKNYNLFEQLFLNQMPYCILIPRAAWDMVGGYDETMRRGYEDWEFNIRLGLNGYYGVVVPEPLFRYRVRASGMLQATSGRQHGRLWADIQARHRDAYTIAGLYRAWRRWRGVPKTYPATVLLTLLVVHRLLPGAAFARLFAGLRGFSHSRRTTAVERARTDALS